MILWSPSLFTSGIHQYISVWISWESQVLPQCHVYPQEIARLIKGVWSPPSSLALLRPYFLGRVALGEVPLDSHENRNRLHRWDSNEVWFWKLWVGEFEYWCNRKKQNLRIYIPFSVGDRGSDLEWIMTNIFSSSAVVFRNIEWLPCFMRSQHHFHPRGGRMLSRFPESFNIRLA